MYSQDLRQAAVKLYNTLQSFRKTSCILGIGTTTIHSWVTKGIMVRPRTYFKKKITDQVIDCIRTIVGQNPFVTRNIIKQKMKDVLKIDISEKLAGVAIKRSGFTKKRVRKRGKLGEVLSTSIVKFKNEINDVSRLDDVICIDECSFRNDDVPLYGYGLSGDRVIVKCNKRTSRSYSLLMSISRATGICDYTIEKGAINSNILKKYLSKPLYNNKTILLDNVSFHKQKDVIHCIYEKQSNFIFTPPYSPDFNPIENVFGIVKYNYRNKFLEIIDMESRIKESINVVKLQTVQNCINRARRLWIE